MKDVIEIVVQFLPWIVLYLLPAVVIARSKRTQGNEKTAWVLAVLFVSWVVLIFYFLLAPLKQQRADGS